MRARAHGSTASRFGRIARLGVTLCLVCAPFARASVEECLADVTVPPTWRLESAEVERREASVRFEVTPARFAARERRVLVHEAASVLTAVQPERVAERQRRETAPATTRWVRGGLDGERPISGGDRIDLIAAGIDPDAVPPGTCLIERYRAPRVSITEERVLVREASEQLGVTPAVFETIRRPITVRSAHSRLIEVPAVWDEEERRVEQPAMLTRVREPAVRESVEVRRLRTDAVASREPISAEWDTIGIPLVEAPGAYVWHVEGAEAEPVLGAAARHGRPARDEGGHGSATGAVDDPSGGAREEDLAPTGRRLCHREVPSRAIEYERLVVREEGRFEREPIEAEHVVMEVQALLEDARGERVEIPAVVETVERRVPIGEARAERYPILCEAELTRRTVTRLQRALAKAGFSPGGIDGRLGPATRGAVDRFQASRELARGASVTGALTIETVEALGVERRGR